MHLLADVVDDDIVAAGVGDHVVVKIDDIVLDISLQTEEETRLNVNIARRRSRLMLSKR